MILATMNHARSPNNSSFATEPLPSWGQPMKPLKILRGVMKLEKWSVLSHCRRNTFLNRRGTAATTQVTVLLELVNTVNREVHVASLNVVPTRHLRCLY